MLARAITSEALSPQFASEGAADDIEGPVAGSALVQQDVAVQALPFDLEEIDDGDGNAYVNDEADANVSVGGAYDFGPAALEKAAEAAELAQEAEAQHLQQVVDFAQAAEAARIACELQAKQLAAAALAAQEARETQELLRRRVTELEDAVVQVQAAQAAQELEVQLATKKQHDAEEAQQFEAAAHAAGEAQEEQATLQEKAKQLEFAAQKAQVVQEAQAVEMQKAIDAHEAEKALAAELAEAEVAARRLHAAQSDWAMTTAIKATVKRQAHELKERSAAAWDHGVRLLGNITDKALTGMNISKEHPGYPSAAWAQGVQLLGNITNNALSGMNISQIHPGYPLMVQAGANATPEDVRDSNATGAAGSESGISWRRTISDNEWEAKRWFQTGSFLLMVVLMALVALRRSWEAKQRFQKATPLKVVTEFGRVDKLCVPGGSTEPGALWKSQFSIESLGSLQEGMLGRDAGARRFSPVANGSALTPRVADSHADALASQLLAVAMQAADSSFSPKPRSPIADEEESLCPQLVVPPGVEFVFAVPEVVKRDRQKFDLNVVDLQGQAICRLVATECLPDKKSAVVSQGPCDLAVQTPCSLAVQTLRGTALARVGTAAVHDSGPESNPPILPDICRADGAVFCNLVYDGMPACGRYFLRHRSGHCLLIFHGDFQGKATNVLDTTGRLVACTERCAHDLNGRPHYQVRVASHVDAGMVLSGLLAIDKVEGSNLQERAVD